MSAQLPPRRPPAGLDDLLQSPASAPDAAAEFKTCCSSFYADDLVRHILGDSFHPGGEPLTRRLLAAVGTGPSDTLLDVAAGQGTSGVLAAATHGCAVLAVDLSADNLARAGLRAEAAGVAPLVQTRVGDAERLPVGDASVDVLLCECAFCTFVDKPTAAAEMVRVLRPGGRLALSDMALTPGDLPASLDTLLMRVACIADAISEDALVEAFRAHGLRELAVTDESDGLREMVEAIRHRLLAVELASKLGKISLGGLDLEAGKHMASEALDAIRAGKIRYVAFTARKP